MASSALSLLLASALCACGGRDEPPRRPNVLLISLDTLRADHLGCYGYGRATSPRIDALAAEGVLFERAISSTSWTLPAHLTMLTGLPISVHGACDDRLWDRRDAAGERLEVPLRARFVSEELGADGYRCAGFVTWKYLEDQFGFGPGFEVWERLGHDLFSHPVHGREWRRLREAGDVEGMQRLATEQAELLEPRPTAPEAVDAGLAWLAGHVEDARTEPFFLFVHLFDVHDPYLPPEGFDRFGDPDYAGAIDGRRVTSPDSPVRGDMATADLERLISLYDGEVLWVDSEVGRLLDGLERLGLEEDTLVIVTSDHGEEFFEHGHKTHRRQLHMESVHVPLVLRWPGALARGQRIGGSVGLIDIAPTLLAAAGARPAAPLPGVDLVALARGELAPKERELLSLLFVFEGEGPPERHLSIVRGDRQELVVARGKGAQRGASWDLAREPSGAGPGIVLDDGHARSLAQRLEGQRALARRLRDAQPSRGGALPALDEHDLAELAAMGYTGASEGSPSGTGAAQERLCLDGCVWWP